MNLLSQNFIVILLHRGEYALLRALNPYDFYWLYYLLHSIGNVPEAFEDLNRIKEITGK